MPRGSNGPNEQARVMSHEKEYIRPNATAGTVGAPAHEKRGYGTDSMQKNTPKKPKGM